MKIILFLSFITLVLVGCHRKEFKAYKGNYVCTRLTTIKETAKPTEYIVDQNVKIEVVKKKRSIIVLEKTIHINNIEPEKLYSDENSADKFTLLFRNDSIFYTSYFKVGDADSIVAYFGVKEVK